MARVDHRDMATSWLDVKASLPSGVALCLLALAVMSASQCADAAPILTYNVSYALEDRRVDASRSLQR
jgi:hypothetical protein